MQDVSLTALVANGESFDSKLVRVVGWATFAFEAQGIFVSQEQAVHAKNGVWLDLRLTPAMTQLAAGHVIVEGVFDATSNGHLGMWSGSLTKSSVFRLGEARCEISSNEASKQPPFGRVPSACEPHHSASR